MGNGDELALCRTTEVAPNTMRGVKQDGDDYLVVNDAGSFHVYRNVCPHRGARLSGGKFAGGVLTCPWHHSRFEAGTGKLVSGPEVGPAIPWVRRFIGAFVRSLREYPVVLRDETVFIARGRATGRR